MSFLSGLGQLAANAVAPALNVGAARAQAQRQEEDAQRQQAIQALMLQRQMQQDRIEAALKQAQGAAATATAGYRDAQRTKLGQPEPTPVTYETDDQGNRVALPTRVLPGETPQPIQTGMRAPPKEEVPHTIATTSGIQQYDPITKTWKSTGYQPFVPPAFSFQTVMGPNGPVVAKGNTKTGDLSVTDVAKPSVGGIAAGTPQQRASLVAGMNTLDTADKDATAYEDKVLAKIHSGQGATPGVVAGTLGSFADPAKHPDLAPLAGGALNAVDADYGKYSKSLTAAANAGMLISQRPSDVRMKKETFLAGISTNPTEDQIMQARQWRADMKAAFHSVLDNAPAGGGRGAGGQPTFDQSAAGSPANRAPARPAPSGGSQLTPAQRQRAASDPEYAAFLRSQGKLP
jgi:hypothetical protein